MIYSYLGGKENRTRKKVNFSTLKFSTVFYILNKADKLSNNH